MLQLIVGRSGSGKTTELYRAMHDTAEHTSAPIVLLVPEQASFDNERRLLKEFGAVLSQRVQVLSFTRLANAAFRQIGGRVGKRLDQTTAMLLMSQALHSIADSLTLYRRHIDNPDYLRTLLAFLSECKQCAITPQMLNDAASTLSSGVLRSKAEETALIFEAYEALVSSAALSDPKDDLTVLSEHFDECTLFDAAHVYVDSFKGFTEQELAILERLLTRADSMTVCLCTDTVTKQHLLNRFSAVADTAERLRDAAYRHHVSVAAVKHLTDNHRTTDPALRALEASCFLPSPTPYTDKTDAVCITACQDRAEECRYIAREIRRQLRENGGHCRDFTVVARNSDSYNDLLVAALSREGLPCTLDVRESIASQPLITLIESALAALDGFEVEDVLRPTKTGLIGVSATSAAALENYAFIWGIRGKQWKVPFALHPGGMKEEFHTRDRERLEHLNRLRRRVVDPLIHLQTRLDGHRTGREFAEAVWKLLQEWRVDRMVRLQVERLKADGEWHAAELAARMWEYTIELLDKFAVLSTTSTAKQFANLFHLAVSSDDIGSIPPALDGVNFGAADRIRYTSPKTVFILGANEGVFPAYPSTSGLLTDIERRKLIEAGLKMADDADHQTASERYYAYMALAAPSERLVVTYTKTADGEVLQPSTLVDMIEQIVPKHAVGTAVGPCESGADAFHRLATVWEEDSEEAASLRAVCEELPAYADRLRALSATDSGFALQDETLAKKLFGFDMEISPSKMDVYHQCPFSYFCHYGLRAYPLKRAEFNPAQVGTLVHHVMYKLLPVYVANHYATCTKDRVRADVEDIIRQYVITIAGDNGKLPDQVEWAIPRLIRFAFELMWRVICELKDSKFVPIGFELDIDDEKREDPEAEKRRVPTWKFQTDDGATLCITGKVDRVDLMKQNGTTYLRVVDYKTGSKTFRLADVVEGLNMQMLVYLFALCESKVAPYAGATPAGVLYLESKKFPYVNVNQELDEQKMDLERCKEMRATGLLINEEAVLRAMEPALGNVFVPVQLTSKGAVSARSSLATLAQFGHIRNRLQALLTKMATQLHGGNVEALPSVGKDDACEYCDYHDICCHESVDPVREIPDNKLADVLKALEAEVDDNGVDA